MVKKEKLMSMEFAKARFSKDSYWRELEPNEMGIPEWIIKGYPVLSDADCNFACHYINDNIEFTQDNVYFFHRWSTYFQDKQLEKRCIKFVTPFISDTSQFCRILSIKETHS